MKGQIFLADVLAVENADPESLGNKPNAFQVQNFFCALKIEHSSKMLSHLLCDLYKI